MFSPNESFKEIHTENLKYLMLPYLLANATNKMLENRKANIQMSQNYYNEYLNLLNHYGLLSG